jgi:hypothetical protein
MPSFSSSHVPTVVPSMDLSSLPPSLIPTSSQMSIRPSHVSSLNPSLELPSTSPPTLGFDRVFQIRTHDGEFSDPTTPWCLTASSSFYGIQQSLLYVRKCDPTGNNKYQLWSTDALEQLQLIGFPFATACIASRARNLFLDECSNAAVGGTKDEAQSFSFVDAGNGEGEQITHMKNGKEFGIGLVRGREFSRSKLYDIQSNNKSLNEWYREYGFGRTNDM